jgi:hypothetical protein
MAITSRSVLVVGSLLWLFACGNPDPSSAERDAGTSAEDAPDAGCAPPVDAGIVVGPDGRRTLTVQVTRRGCPLTIEYRIN